MPRNAFEEGRNGEDGPGRKPTANVVAADVEEHRVVGDVENVVLQLFKRGDACHLLTRFGVAEDEIAKAHVFFHEVAQVDVHLLRVLVYKAKSLFLGLFAVVCFGAFQDERHKLVAAAYLAQQLDARLGVLYAVFGKAYVADDAQDVVGVFVVVFHRLFVCSCENHFGPAPHSQGGSLAVKGLGGYALAVNEDVAVQVGKDGGVEAYAVFNQQNHLHAAFLGVVFHVHLVFDKLDDGENEVGVAQPAEHIVEDAEVFVLHSARYAVRKWRKHHARHHGEPLFYGMRHGKCVVVGIAGHADNEVYANALHHLFGLFNGANLLECGRIAQP